MLPVAIVGLASQLTDRFSAIVAHGPIQQDHVDIDCTACHTSGDSSARQQIQANLSFALGRRSNSVNFGYLPVTSDQCLACHERPNDRHPIYRFNEPRFADVRQKIKVNSCLGCHSEHTDTRVSVSITICSYCHDDLELKNDPLDVEHFELVTDNKWSSCLGCHDFHGNHPHESQTAVSRAFDADVICDYFGNGISPYKNPKIFETTCND